MPAHTHKGSSSRMSTGDKKGNVIHHYTGKTRRQTREERKAGRSNVTGRGGWRIARKFVQQFKRNF